MNKYQIYLLVGALILCGGFWLFTKMSESEPETFRNALICPVCGKQLPKADSPCVYCEAKKNREEMEANARGGAPKQVPTNKKTEKIILAFCASSILLGLAFWPRIKNFIRPPKDRNAVYLTFRCTRCGRKLRYLSSKAGMTGQCPTCRTKCTFPIQDPSLSNKF